MKVCSILRVTYGDKFLMAHLEKAANRFENELKYDERGNDVYITLLYRYFNLLVSLLNSLLKCTICVIKGM